MSMHDPAHPGRVLKESIDARKLSVRAAADLLGVSAALLSRILAGRTSLSPRVALGIERAGWTNADVWVRMQASYDLAQARREVEVA